MENIQIQIRQIEEEMSEIDSLNEGLKNQKSTLVKKINKILDFIYFKSANNEETSFWRDYVRISFDDFMITREINYGNDYYVLKKDNKVYFDGGKELISDNFDKVSGLIFKEYYKVYNYASEKLNKKQILFDQIKEKINFEI